MPRSTFATVINTGEQTLGSVQANKADLPHLEETSAQLAKALDGAKAAGVQQDAFRAQFQQATRDVEKFVSEVRELTTRLRNGVRTKYGLRSEKLAEFGLQPRRRAPAKARAIKEKPAPVAQPVPAPKTTAESNP